MDESSRDGTRPVPAPPTATSMEVVCTVEGTITLKATMEYATEEDFNTVLNRENIRSTFSKVLREILEHSYDYTSRGPDGCSLGWHEDDNREAYVEEVINAGLAVKNIDLYPS